MGDKKKSEKDLIILKKTLKTIFGPTEGEGIFFNFINNRNLLATKVKKNETFTFRKAKNSS